MIIIDPLTGKFLDQKTILANGVTVLTRTLDPGIYHPLNSLIGVDLTAGGRHAPPGQMHFLEHILARAHQKPWAEFAQHYDYEFEGTNAVTFPHRMTYGLGLDGGTQIVLDDVLPILRLNLDMIKNPNFTSGNIELERGRILEEIVGMGLGEIRKWNFLSKRFGISYTNGGLGTVEEVQAISAANLSDQYNQLYVGNNILVFATFPLDASGKVSHDSIVELVQQEFGNFLPGIKAQDLKSPNPQMANLRLNNCWLSDKDSGYVEIVTSAARRFQAGNAAETAFSEIYGSAVKSAVRDSGLAYHFYKPILEDFDSNQCIVTSFQASSSKIRPVIDIIIEKLQWLATGDIEAKVEHYRRCQIKSYAQSYRTPNDAYGAMKYGYLYEDDPKNPNQLYIDASSVTADAVQYAARKLIYAPLAIRADIGADGDPEGKYVPFVSEFAEQLRAGVPKPEEPSNGNMDFLPRGAAANAKKFGL